MLSWACIEARVMVRRRNPYLSMASGLSDRDAPRRERLAQTAEGCGAMSPAGTTREGTIAATAPNAASMAIFAFGILLTRVGHEARYPWSFTFSNGGILSSRRAGKRCLPVRKYVLPTARSAPQKCRAGVACLLQVTVSPTLRSEACTRWQHCSTALHGKRARGRCRLPRPCHAQCRRSRRSVVV